MSRFTYSRHRALQLFVTTLSITIAVWLLRGFGILTFIPGGVIWLLLMLAIATGIVSTWRSRWIRY